ncbi:MAG TPA: vitamin B12-dependent ribonucleotide reductase [Candidatus Paceibacterota bacterium]|nr:vitamin B12-dependent ribonucleotide reductase [Candidatus Paceibacterota bacterium]
MIKKYFSKSGNPYEDGVVAKFLPRDVQISDDSGKVIEVVHDAIFPENWSVNSANTVATKYFRKEGVPETGREIDLRQLARRVGSTIRNWAVNQKYFDDNNAKELENELVAATIGQYGAFNSPVWFNLGLGNYGINQKEQNYFVDPDGNLRQVENYYDNPQVSACFIVSPEDSIESMINVGAVTASRIFKGGSGIGGDWSHVRSTGEPVSGGGVASGAVRFMDVEDSCARVIKSGGKTRRAATMQSMGVWHPDMLEVLKHKYKEEEKARVLIEAGSPGNWESHTIQDLRAQNVNISIRTDDEFWNAYENNKMYQIRGVIGNKVLREEPASKLLEMMAFATYNCGDPGIQNHSIINKWHTCKNSGEIWASNPCSEYMFLNNSACNLASLNLMKFRKNDGSFDVDSFSKAVDLYITAQDVLVSQASYPTKEIAWNSHIFRPLGLGYANLGAYIMSLGLAYDSEESRDFASAVTSLMTAEAYLQSTKIAEKLGAFQEYEKNKEPMLDVIEMHRKASKHLPKKNGLEKIVDSANKKWDEVVERGKKFGFRNSQVTLLAPTGTIGFMMGCDTTGCEPAYGLKVYKELAGGGMMKIVNNTVPLALENLGYDKKSVEEIIKYIDQNESVEGCKKLKEEHLSVFDCASQAGIGTRAISPMGHIKMLGAIQPYLSGAISKTINCPANTSVEEIGDMFYQGWKLGVKALAIYRDGSKASQPLKTKKKSSFEILKRGEREHLPKVRKGLTQKVKLGGISLFIRTGEYEDGRLGEIFVDSLERGSEVNRLLNLEAIQFSEKLQYGVPLEEALEVLSRAGQSQISGFTDHPFIKNAKGIDGFLCEWIKAHYLGDISNVSKDPEMRPLPSELRVYQNLPKLHLMPTVAGEKFYPGVPSLEETIQKISGTNYWKDEELDTRKTIDKIKRTRIWGKDQVFEEFSGKITGKTCSQCGNLMISDGNCWKCISCKTSTGGCGGG